MFFESYDEDLTSLILTSAGAGAGGLILAEGFRFVFERIIAPRLRSGTGINVLLRLHEVVHAAISAFILYVCTFEKAMVLWGNLFTVFYVYTFILGIAYSSVFASSSPSPCFPLIKHWKKINDGQREGGSSIVSTLRSTLSYFQHGASYIFGQYLGLQCALLWLKYFWDGWWTSHHVNKLPILDKCLPCLNAGTILGFAIEFGVTITYLYAFSAIDTFLRPRDGVSKLLTSKLFKNAIKSAMSVAILYIFIDVTGSFANPFLAVAMQRQCFNDVTTSLILIAVYVIAPFAATIAFLKLTDQSSVDGKAKGGV